MTFLGDCYVKVTGHVVSMDVLARIGLGSFCDQLLELIRQVRCLKLDLNEYICLKFVILLNPGECMAAVFSALTVALRMRVIKQ
jgi:hypothetical protein